MKGFAKYIFFFTALLIALGSLLYTNSLVRLIKDIERQRVELWAEAYSELVQSDISENVSNVVFKMIRSNTTIPVIIADGDGNLITYANIDPEKAQNPDYIRDLIFKMSKQHNPITIDFGGYKNYIYYLDSELLTKLQTYPAVQFGFVILFMIVVMISLKFSQKAEEHKMLVGMSKETAHQLGTPLSSLMAWLEILKMSEESPDRESIIEVEKDIKRLTIITERFARIGSKPKLEQADLIKIIKETTDYLKKRTSSQISFEFYYDLPNITLNINEALISWTIENLWKNAADAMAGKGKIIISVKNTEKNVIIDFSDTGKGIPKRKHKSVFRPGYTSKKHGWGLGLTLVKRIIEDYHKGKIFIKASEPSKGTTFRIILTKN